VYLALVKKVAQKAITERFVAVVRSKIVSPSWSDVRAALLDFDRAGRSPPDWAWNQVGFRVKADVASGSAAKDL
jgi:hypothetical protein